MKKPVALETVSVVDAAVNRLRASLFAGQYHAGEELKDTQLAADFGIARPTMRAVVQQLVAERMLERAPGHSARVRSFDAAQVADIYRVREIIELDAIRAIRNVGADIRGVEEALASFNDPTLEDDWVRIAEVDVAFHHAVVRTGGSVRLQEIFETVANESRLLIAQLRGRYDGREALYAEHAELVAALRDAPVPQLEAAWAEHLGDAARYLAGHLSEL